jgi:cation diffusion facilitator family transporter
MNGVAAISAAERARESQRVTLVGAVVNLVLSLAKILIGLLAHSQALVADGLHSLSDLASDALVYWAAHHSAQAPDEEHPYGHGRFETAATLGLAVILLLVGLFIVWDAASRLFHPEELLEPGLLALVAAVASILLKEWLYHYTVRVARRINSEMLRANAWHHRTDAISSVVVVVGIAGTMAGLPYLDAVAAAAVGLMIGHIAWELGWPALRELMDAALDHDRVEQIRRTILDIGGVRSIHMLRTRKLGGQASVDVHVQVAPWLSVSEGHMIGQVVMERLLAEIDEVADVTVHIDPEDDETALPCTGLPLRHEAEQRLAGLWREIRPAYDIQRLVLHYLDGRIDIDAYLPLTAFRGADEAGQLRRLLREALTGAPEFGAVRVYFG